MICKLWLHFISPGGLILRSPWVLSELMDYLIELCEDLNLDPNLEKTDEGSFLLPINASLRIEVTPLSPGALFFSPIRSCPKKKKEELFIQLMKANLFGQGTLGAAIGLDPKGKFLTLSSSLAYDMDYRGFKEAMEDFANIVEYWREEIDQHVKLSKGGIL